MLLKNSLSVLVNLYSRLFQEIHRISVLIIYMLEGFKKNH